MAEPILFRDARGISTGIGDRVVFNLSGGLAVGKVEEVKLQGGHRGRVAAERGYRNLKYLVTIREDGNYYGKPSKVRNTDGIVRVESL